MILQRILFIGFILMVVINIVLCSKCCNCKRKGREGKGREGKEREGKEREGKEREGKGREGKGREKGKNSSLFGRPGLLYWSGFGFEGNGFCICPWNDNQIQMYFIQCHRM